MKIPLVPQCAGCDERARRIAEWLEACKRWALSPFGPMPPPPQDPPKNS